MGLDYVDIFYSHRFDPDTPLEETMGALDYIVRSGRALYAGISSYNSKKTREAVAILKELGTPTLIHQSKPEQIVDCVGTVKNLEFTADELTKIDEISSEEDINLWAKSSHVD